MVYFTADLHLGHAAVIGLCGRPFASCEEMDEALIANWNARVGERDVVYIAGDLMWKCADPEAYLARLKGRKILVRGNHDGTWLQKTDASRYFEQVAPLIEESLNGHPVTVCHYPMLEWKNSRKEGSRKLGYLVCGHLHNRAAGEAAEWMRRTPNALNAGVDVNGFRPVTFAELERNNRLFYGRGEKEN